MNKKKLKVARNKVDQIDNKIFDLIRKRTEIIKFVLSLKKYKKQIVDHKRIGDILKKIKNKSVRYSIDSKLTSRIWKSIIWSYVEFEKRKFKKK
jgi:chorismate mutase|tara:strand:+ start:440 stop:721 length:282 start_codon:yes stop_codon:yes gene_type:complete